MLALTLTLAATTATATAISSDFSNLARTVNNANPGWHAEPPTQFDNMDQVKTLCGALRDDRIITLAKKTIDNNSLPIAFDSRTTWSNCSIIGKVGSQAGCGDCWAWSATQVLESYMCIKGNLKPNIELSKLDTAACCRGSLCGGSKSCTAGKLKYRVYMYSAYLTLISLSFLCLFFFVSSYLSNMNNTNSFAHRNTILCHAVVKYLWRCQWWWL